MLFELRSILPKVRSASFALLASAAILAAPACLAPARAAETVLYSFTGGADGGVPHGFRFDTQGAIYGTTFAGGSNGYGTVFKLTPVSGAGPWNMTVIHNFKGQPNGTNPSGTLRFDSDGALFGTTYAGGSQDYGTVYKLMPPSTGKGLWTETVLHSFKGGTDGFGGGGFIFDHQGALYGLALPTGSNGASVGSATVFKLTPPPSDTGTWAETVLHTFGAVGGVIGLMFDTQGDLYGTLPYVATNGAVFRLAPPAAGQTQWNFSTPYVFHGQPDGIRPAGVIFGPGGALYGGSLAGGTSGNGTIFQVTLPNCQ